MNSPVRELCLDGQAGLRKVSRWGSERTTGALTDRSGRHILNVWHTIILCLLYGFGLVDLDLLSAQARTESLLSGCLDGQRSRSLCLGVSCFHAQGGAIAWASRCDEGIGIQFSLLSCLFCCFEARLERVVFVILVASEGRLGSLVGRSLRLLVQWFRGGGSLMSIRQILLVSACSEHVGRLSLSVGSRWRRVERFPGNASRSRCSPSGCRGGLCLRRPP